MQLNLFGRRRGSEKPVLNSSHKSKASTVHRQADVSKGTIDSLAKMRETLTNLDKREQFLSVKANAYITEAMEKNKAGDKKGAVAAMTRKKLYDAEVSKIIQMKGNIEAQMLSLETANVTITAQQGMQAGLTAQRQVNKLLNVDEIGEIHTEIEEHLNNADEATRILAQTFNAGELFDDDALLAELQELQNEDSSKVQATDKQQTARNELDELNQLMESMPTVSVTPTLPEAPTSQPEMDHTDSIYDLNFFQQQMGL